MVSIDTVYQKVLALANKEQRGYITPQDFNLFAKQAQLDLNNRPRKILGYKTPNEIMNQEITNHAA